MRLKRKRKVVKEEKGRKEKEKGIKRRKNTLTTGKDEVGKEKGMRDGGKKSRNTLHNGGNLRRKKRLVKRK